MRWTQVNVCVLGSFIFPNWQSFVWNYFRMQLPEAVFPLRQSCKSGRVSGLSLSKCFGPISGLHTKLFYNIKRVMIFFFRDVHLLCSLQNFCEWSDFTSANSICKHSCVLLFSAQINPITVFEKATVVRKSARDGFVSKRSITYAMFGLF